jgi:hypothetical protein
VRPPRIDARAFAPGGGLRGDHAQFPLVIELPGTVEFDSLIFIGHLPPVFGVKGTGKGAKMRRSPRFFDPRKVLPEISQVN